MTVVQTRSETSQYTDVVPVLATVPRVWAETPNENRIV